MELLINFLIVEIILVAIMFVVFWCILANYIISYLKDINITLKYINRTVEKGFMQLNKAIYESAEYIVKSLNKRD